MIDNSFAEGSQGRASNSCPAPHVSLLIYRRMSNSKSAHGRNMEISATVTVVSTDCDISTVLNTRHHPRDSGPLICGWLGALGKEQESGCLG